jgi:hypothetical protein
MNIYFFGIVKTKKNTKTNNTLREKKQKTNTLIIEKTGPARNIISQIIFRKKKVNDSSLKYK